MRTLDAAERDLARRAAEGIHDGFVNYNSNFRRLSRRARRRFENRDWKGLRRDLSERIELYDKSVSRTLSALRPLLGAQMEEHRMWRAVRAVFWNRVDDIPDGVFSKTFFNSLYRDVLRSLDVDPGEVSDTADIVPLQAPVRVQAPLRNYINWNDVGRTVQRLLDDFAFETPYIDVAADVEFVCREIREVVSGAGQAEAIVRRIEVMREVFFQSSRAFIIGRLFWSSDSCPFVLAFTNDVRGVQVEAVLTTADDVSVLFGFTRSYFMVDVEPVEGAVYYLQSMIPRKPVDELYTILGRARQGKTERARSFYRHLADCEDRFVHAAGERGLVMLVFTLPSYDLVFKVIRDRFGYPKNVSHEEVKGKYKFVFNHDRAGRLIDTQEFRSIEFPLAKFSDELLDELLSSAANTVRVEGDQLVIDHLYSERRLVPLNLYLQQQHPERARLAILDYGQAVRDLAMSNIFPGDLLLKNFGVSRHGHVIFYDYDELCLVTECRFRELPQAAHPEDELRDENWFYVADHDIFPEEFLRFLAIEAPLREVFLETHGELLRPEWWRRVQQLHRENRAPEVAPYYRLASRRAVR